HLLRALAGFAVAVVAGFQVSPPVLDFLAAPVSAELERFFQRRQGHVAQRLAAGDPRLAEVNRPRDVEVLVPVGRLRALLGLPAGTAEAEWQALPLRVRPLDWALATGEAAGVVGRPPTLIVLGAAEAFTTYFKVSLWCGVVLASPWIFYQLWLFVAAGL